MENITMSNKEYNNQASIDAARNELVSWIEAFNSQDINALIAHYDPDIVYMNADTPAAVGIDSVSQWFSGAFPNTKDLTLYLKEEYAFAGSDMAVLIETYLFKPNEGVNMPESTGRATFVFRLNAAGEWKLVHDIDNSPPDTTPELFR